MRRGGLRRGDKKEEEEGRQGGKGGGRCKRGWEQFLARTYIISQPC